MTHWLKAGIGIAGVLGLALMVALPLGIQRQMNALATANSDNVQWNLSQVEVEYLTLRTALLEADDADATELSGVRSRFDILYSRIDTMRSSSVFAPLRDIASFDESLSQIENFLERNTALIDGPVGKLAAGLPQLEVEASELRVEIRALALEGIGVFAEQSDRRRRSVATTLVFIAGVTLGLVIVLLAVLGVLLRLYRQGRRRATDLQTATSRLRAIVATSLDAILVIDREGLILDYNGAAEKIFRYSRDETIGRRLSELIVPEQMRDAHETGMRRYRETGEKHVTGMGQLELEARRKSGEVFPVEVSINTAQSEGGEIFVSFLRDISARKATEVALLKARDDALAGEKAKADLLAVMSHEMRTPLNGLLGMLDILSDTVLNEKQRSYVAIMEVSGKQLLHHVNDVLDISRLDSGRFDINVAPFDLEEMVREVLESQQGVATAGGTLLKIERLPEGEQFVLGDSARLRQILLNLIGNALKFTHGGTVSVDVAAIAGTGNIEFRISDTGVGIPKDALERIFEEFVTIDTSYGRQTSGTGLGLAITRRLVMALGGEIGVESELGKGSEFWFRLPLALALVDAAAVRDADETAAGAAAGEAGGDPLNVLVVEDNATNRLVAREMLEGLGHEVTEAHGGSQGVSLAVDICFDLILMDISMPGMDGIQAARMIRANGASRGARIVALTAHALPHQIDDFKGAGMDDVLIKPMSRARLVRVLDAARDHPELGSADEDEPSLAPEHLIEVETFRSMAETFSADRLRSLVERLVAEAEATLVPLVDTTPAAEDLATLRGRVHKLAGSVAVFGATDLHARLSNLEALVDAGRVADLAEAYEDALTSWAATRERLAALVDGIAGAPS
jgi:PAS domain S-box-containing protein